MRRFAVAVLFTAGIGAGALAPNPASAEGLTIGGASGKSRASMFAAQTRLLDTRLAKQYEASARYKPKSKGDDGTVPRFAGSYRGEFLEVAKSAARKHGVPEDLFLRLVQQESGWNHLAVSTKGATGLAQLMPGTAALLNVDINDPAENLDGGAKYLRRMYDRFGTWKLALAAYNAGPEAVDAANGVPAFQETETYVSAIIGG